MATTSHADHGGLGMHADLTQYATRTLDFLNIIEKTLKSVTEEVDLIQTLTAGCVRHTAKIRNLAFKQELDPAGRISELLAKAAASAGRSYEEAIAFRNSARADTALHPDDGVVECFEGLVAALADLHNSIEDLRDAVEIHDSLLSPVTGTYADVEALIASLKG